MLSALDHAGALPLEEGRPAPHGSISDLPRTELTRDEVNALLLREADRHTDAAAEYDRLGHAERADDLRREASIIRRALEHVTAVMNSDRQ